MKRPFFLLVFSFVFLTATAQKQYRIDGVNYELKTEISGTIDLLWNVIDREFRYFVSRDNSIVELVNTEGDDGQFQEEYKDILSDLTGDQGMDVSKVNLTLYDLKVFIDRYNGLVNPDYESQVVQARLGARATLFAGLSNSPFVENPDNGSNALFGFEISVFGGQDVPRHALFFEFRQILKSDNFDYSTTQLGLGYRLRLIRREGFNLYAQTLFSSVNFSERTFSTTDDMDVTVIETESDTEFETPFSFGIGADIKVGPRSFISLVYSELFAIFQEHTGNFPINFTVGYKFTL